ncbi:MULTISPECIES: pyridoxamine 5'-phosphate oxidase family protein [unclassified Beijerinckia]|uniref:HugZ family pyridoxamine 5'-phosphate oxidase n=1 Tax=unclassified Beijerinckia TaxID=2638183 RepID=UPI000898E401|nr:MULTISPECIES: pyridoxamine 5'-phosphate oxidase family protein [unclassified Beijerinckia]MDH7794981.1 putative heme iron utilization protein [Beijerinckia sp. GAS462]SEB82793.1 hypothetical protein SAMN05443249_1254 [Beijerinckia sp. 28-YEA-48]
MPVITPRGLEINLDAALPLEAVHVARALLRTSRIAALATIDPSGYPYSTVTNLAIEPNGTPFFYTAGLALHARNIDGDERISLTVAETSTDVMTTPRLTLVGRAVLVPDHEIAELKQRYVDRYPKGKLYLSLRDSRLYRLQVEGVQLNGGPARNANDVQPQDLLTELAGAEALMASASEIIAVLNSGEQPSNLAVRSGAKLGRWRVTSIDPTGIDLATTDALARLWLPQPVHSKDEFFAALAEIEAQRP